MPYIQLLGFQTEILQVSDKCVCTIIIDLVFVYEQLLCKALIFLFHSSGYKNSKCIKGSFFTLYLILHKKLAFMCNNLINISSVSSCFGKVKCSANSRPILYRSVVFFQCLIDTNGTNFISQAKQKSSSFM